MFLMAKFACIVVLNLIPLSTNDREMQHVWSFSFKHCNVLIDHQ